MKLILKTGLLGLMLTTATGADAERLGRLFFSPEQRAQLEYSQQKDRDTSGKVRSLTVNGIVQKHGGGRTIWINGVPQFSGASNVNTAESLPVTVPGQSRTVEIKVGQKLLVKPSASDQ